MALTTVALPLWVLSLTQAKFTIGYYGLISSLPPTFFIALSLLVLASAILWTSPRNEWKLLLLQLSFFILALWSTPLIIGGALPFKDISYEHYAAFVTPITQQTPSFAILPPGVANLQGHLYPDLVWYHNWPGYWIYLGVMTEIAGLVIFPDIVVAFFPMLFQFLILIPLYVLLKDAMCDEPVNHLWAALLVFCLGQWTGQFYLGAAQGPGFFIALLFLALLLRPGVTGKVSFGESLTFVILIFALPISHYTTTAFFLFILAALFFAKRVRSPNLVLMSFLIATAWMMYYASYWFNKNLPGHLVGMYRFDLLLLRYFGLLESGTVEGVTASVAHTDVARIRAAQAVLLFALAGIGFLAARISQWRISRWKIPYSEGSLIVIVFGATFPIAFAGIGGESFERWWIFTLPVVGFFAAKMLRFRLLAPVFVVGILVAIPLNIVAHTGNQAIDYRSVQFYASSRFLQEETAKVSIVTGANDPYYRLGLEHPRWEGLDFDQIVWENGNLYSGEGKQPHFVNIGGWDQRYYAFALNKPEYIPEFREALDSAPNYSRIYDNGDQTVFVSEHQVQPPMESTR